MKLLKEKQFPDHICFHRVETNIFFLPYHCNGNDCAEVSEYLYIPTRVVGVLFLRISYFLLQLLNHSVYTDFGSDSHVLTVAIDERFGLSL